MIVVHLKWYVQYTSGLTSVKNSDFLGLSVSALLSQNILYHMIEHPTDRSIFHWLFDTGLSHSSHGKGIMLHLTFCFLLLFSLHLAFLEDFFLEIAWWWTRLNTFSAWSWTFMFVVVQWQDRHGQCQILCCLRVLEAWDWSTQANWCSSICDEEGFAYWDVTQHYFVGKWNLCPIVEFNLLSSSVFPGSIIILMPKMSYLIDGE